MIQHRTIGSLPLHALALLTAALVACGTLPAGSGQPAEARPGDTASAQLREGATSGGETYRPRRAGRYGADDENAFGPYAAP